MKTSLIISVYKDIENLRIILEALKLQSYLEFEIVISEDGESEEMKRFISEYSYPKEIIHCTQEDEGWRKNRALNNAIRTASGNYLIFIDGDCVPHHKFIENHLRASGPNKIVAGKRVKLGPYYSEILKQDISGLKKFEKKVTSRIRAVRRDGAKFYEEAFYFNPSGPLGFIPKVRKMKQLKGCNMSFYREAIIAINGFDEDYQLPAIGEDIDLTWRFKGLGYSLESVRNLAVQYHLYHEENWTDQSENQRIMNEKKAMDKFICENGLKKEV